MNENTPYQGILLPKVFSQAFTLYREHFQPFILLSLIYAIAVMAVKILVQRLWPNPQTSLAVLMTANTLILCRMAVMLIRGADKAYRNEPVELTGLFAETRDRYLPYVLVYLSLFALMGVGFFVFILPGLYFGTLFIFADILTVLENKDFRASFSRSRDLVKGMFWQVGLFLLALILLSLSPMVLFQMLGAGGAGVANLFAHIFSVLFVPFYMIVQVVLYHHLKDIKDSERQPKGELL